MSSLPSLSFGIPLGGVRGELILGAPNEERGKRTFAVPRALGSLQCFLAVLGDGDGLCTHSSPWVPLDDAFFSREYPLPTPQPTTDSDMPPSQSICPSAKVPAPSHWGIIGLGWGGRPFCGRRLGMSVGVGPWLTHILVSSLGCCGSGEPTACSVCLRSSCELLSRVGGGGCSLTCALMEVRGQGEGG